MSSDHREDASWAEIRGLIDAGRFDPALRRLDGLGTAADCRSGRVLRAAACLGRRHRDRALALLRPLLAEAPDDPELLFLLGRVHLAANAAFAAATAFQRVAELAPGWPGLAEALAGAWRRDARYEDVLALAAGHPPGIHLLYESAMARAHLGDAAGALADYDAVLVRDPGHGAAWLGSHAPALDLHGPAEALRRLRCATAAPGANTKYWGSLCGLLLLLGEDEEAEAVFRSRIEGHPKRRALVDGVRAIRPFLAADCRPFGLSAALLRHAVAAAPPEGLVLEFGVRRGTSIRQIAAVAGQAVHGFDSFEGLPEAWNNEARGVMTTGAELPAVPSSVTLHAGWFADTLPPFLARHGDKVRFVNVDCDIYSSAATVLTLLADRLPPGAVLVFDEFIGNRHWRQDEYRAFQEFIAATGRSYEIIAVGPWSKQVAVRLEGAGS